MKSSTAFRTAIAYHWRYLRSILGLNLLGAMMLFVAAPCAWSAEGAGTVKTLVGSASVSRDGSMLPLAIGQRIFPGDRIATERNSYIGIMLYDDTRLTLGPSSALVVRSFLFNVDSNEGSMGIAILKGTLRAVTGLIGKLAPESVTFTTPSATIGVRGTDFVIDLGDSE